MIERIYNGARQCQPWEDGLKDGEEQTSIPGIEEGLTPLT